MPSKSGKPARLTFEQLRDGVRQRYVALWALEVQYVQTSHGTVGGRQVIPVMKHHFAFKGDKRFASQADGTGEPFDKDLPPEHVWAYDGNVMRHYRVMSTHHPHYRGTLDISTEIDRFVHLDSYAHAVGIRVEGAERGGCTSPAKCLPDALELVDYEWKVRPTLETVDGADCHVLESKYRDLTWIDTEAAFAVRFRLWHQRVPNRPEHEWPLAGQCEFRNFQQLGGNVWLPRKVAQINYASCREPESAWNTPEVTTVQEVHELKVNDRVADGLFKLACPPGTMVHDSIQDRVYRISDSGYEVDTGKPWYANL